MLNDKVELRRENHKLLLKALELLRQIKEQNLKIVKLLRSRLD